MPLRLNRSSAVRSSVVSTVRSSLILLLLVAAGCMHNNQTAALRATEAPEQPWLEPQIGQRAYLLPGTKVMSTVLVASMYLRRSRFGVVGAGNIGAATLISIIGLTKTHNEVIIRIAPIDRRWSGYVAVRQLVPMLPGRTEGVTLALIGRHDVDLVSGSDIDSRPKTSPVSVSDGTVVRTI